MKSSNKRLTRAQYFMEIAKLSALRSPCLSRQVGCVALNHDRKIAGVGYNGPPAGIDHCDKCYRSSGENLEKCFAVHAEVNAILQMKDSSQLYAIFTTDKPCPVCMTILLNTSCYLIVYLNDYPIDRERLWVSKGRVILDYRTCLLQESFLLI